MTIEAISTDKPVFSAESIIGEDLDKTKAAIIALEDKTNEIIPILNNSGNELDFQDGFANALASNPV